jgi:hypothetical protein
MKDLNELEPEVPAEEIAADDQPAEETPKAEEPKEPPKAEPEEKKQTMVPHGALHEERQKRKQFEHQLAQERAERQRNEAIMADRLRQLYEVAQPKPPNEQEDPVGAAIHGVKMTQEQLAQIQRRQQYDDQQRQAEHHQRQVITWAAGQADEFRAENPDFDDAYSHLRGMRTAELKAMGLSPPEVAQALYNDEMWVFQRAAQSGRNPAELAFNMAQAAGWKKAEVKAPPVEKIEQINKGMGAAKALGTSGGQAGMPTPEQIAAMDDHEFAQFKAELGKKGKRISDVM